MKTKVGAAAFDDPVVRFAVAVPSAIAITALGRCQPADRTLPENAPATTVVLERAAPTPPPPTPRPTPPPTLPPVPRVTLAPVPQRAAPRAVHASGGGHAAPPHPHIAPPAVVVAGSGGGAGTGEGSGQGAGDAGGSGNGTVSYSVTANPGTLSPGVYSGQISIQAGSLALVIVPVIMTVSSNPQAVLLTQTGMSFTAVSQGGVVPPQTFGILNVGTGVMNWTAAATTTGGGNWMAISPTSGSTDPTKAAPQISVSIDTKNNLPPPGVYYGTVRVNAVGTANGTREITVYLNVLPAGTSAVASVQPTELVFYTTTAADDSPGSQPLNVYNIAAAPRSFSTQVSAGLSAYCTTIICGVQTLPGYFPFSYAPTTAMLDPQQPTEVVVQPGCPYCTGVSSTFSTAGTYNKDALTFQFSDGTVQTVKVTVVSSPPGAAPVATDSARRADTTTNCAGLVLSAPTLTEGFSVNAAWPNAITVNVTDCLNNPLTEANGGAVSVQFSDQTALKLQSLNNGIWQGTWKPGSNTANNSISLTITASAKGVPSPPVKLSGQSLAQSNAPILSLMSMATVAATVGSSAPLLPSTVAPTSASNPVTSPLTVISPGSLLAIYADPDGPPLADSAATATLDQNHQTLPTVLGGTSVFFDDLPAAPIYSASPNQLIVVVPSGVNINSSSQIVVSHPNAVALSVPVAINVAAAQPMSVGMMDTTSGLSVQPGASVPAGHTLTIYTTGLGATNPPLPDGAVTPHDQPYIVVGGVNLTIGGQSVTASAQLVPGYVGLYQITIPASASATMAPSSLSVGGQTTTLLPVSNTTGNGGLPAVGSLAEVVSGGGWNFELDAVNLGGSPATAQVNFTDGSGAALPLPLTFPQTPPPAFSQTSATTIQPNARVVIDSSGSATSAQLLGSGQLLSNGNVSGFGIFSYPAFNWNAVVPLEMRQGSTYSLPFDNTGVLTTGVALANTSASAANIARQHYGDHSERRRRPDRHGYPDVHVAGVPTVPPAGEVSANGGRARNDSVHDHVARTDQRAGRARQRNRGTDDAARVVEPGQTRRFHIGSHLRRRIHQHVLPGEHGNRAGIVHVELLRSDR